MSFFDLLASGVGKLSKKDEQEVLHSGDLPDIAPPQPKQPIKVPTERERIDSYIQEAIRIPTAEEFRESVRQEAINRFLHPPMY